MLEILICLIFVLAVVCLISVLFTEKKGLFLVLSVILLGGFYLLNRTFALVATRPLAVFLAGATLLALELFIPSFGLIGLSGCGLVGLSLYNSWLMDGREIFLTLSASLAIVLTLTVYVLLGFRARIFDKEILARASSKERRFGARADRSSLVGKVGRSKSILRPSGKVEICGLLYDALSQGALIEAGKDVEVVSFTNGHLVVKEI